MNYKTVPYNPQLINIFQINDLKQISTISFRDGN